MLASFLVKTAATMGKKASALITNMDTPLGWKVGNFLEIEETLECLQGHGPEDVMDETYALGAEMLMLGGTAATKEDGMAKCRAAVTSGKALTKFLENVQDQGGNPDKLLSEQGKRRSPFHVTLHAQQDGYISLDAYLTGLAGIDLGVGRSRTTDPVCPDAGLILHAKTGSRVKAGDAIMEVYGKNEICLAPACARLEKAVSYSPDKPEKKPLIYREIHL
ncbi:MAG: thymidine phosphorylase, partial [Treponema sp.]|nr:thymidine phosphorylase [Treponema sp.]